MMGKQPECVGVAFEVDKVGPLFVCELELEFCTFAFRKECGDGFLARMAEWRVAQVVGQTCGCHYVAYVVQL